MLANVLAVAMLVLLVGDTAHAQQVKAESSRAEQDYLLYCMGCHQRDGTGSGAEVPPLVGVDRFTRLPEGREYLVRVPGVANAGLSDQRLAALLNWTLRSFGSGGFVAYTADEVGPLRDSPFINAVKSREAVVAALSELDEPAATPTDAAGP